MTYGVADNWGKDGLFIKKSGQLAIIGKNEFHTINKNELKVNILM